MKILQLAKKFPYPVKDGEVIGIINLTKGFAQLGHEVTVLALNTNKHYFNPEHLPSDVAALARWEAIDIDTSLSKAAAFKNLFTDQSYNIERFYSAEYEARLTQLLQEENFDVVLLEGIYLMRYIDAIRAALKRSGSKAVVVQRPQNVEFKIWERLAKQERNPLKRAYLDILAKRMKRFELDQVFKADVVIPVSKVDLDLFKSMRRTKTPAVAIPTGYVFDTLPDFTQIEEEHAVAFIGGMDWLPNLEGVKWFLREVWPMVLRQKKDAKFYIAGRNFPADLLKTRMKGVRIVGEVEDAQQFLLSKSICIVPLFAGSGMRVKIIEAMALGRAVVSTTIGAESINYTTNKNIQVADSARNFATYITDLLYNKEKRLALGKSAQDLIREEYDNRKICQQILSFIEQNRKG